MELFIPVAPKPKGRPRFSRGKAYTPPATKASEDAIAHYVKSRINGAPLEGALRVDIEMVFPIPKSWSDKKKSQAAACQILPAVRPDIDNTAKLLMDSLNGILWHDDGQIVQLFASKRYGYECGYHLKVTRPKYGNILHLRD